MLDPVCVLLQGTLNAQWGVTAYMFLMCYFILQITECVSIKFGV